MIVTLSFIISAYILNAHTLYGTTRWGGINDGGTICKLVTSTNTLIAAFSFDGNDGRFPYGSSLVQSSDGKLYGMTNEGGINSYGAGLNVLFFMF
jgi:hypothetical protein